jgi:hypothetical protein
MTYNQKKNEESELTDTMQLADLNFKTAFRYQ